MLRLFLCFTLGLSLFLGSASGFAQNRDAELNRLLVELDKLQEALNNYQGQVSQAEAQLQEQELLLAQNHREIFTSERAIAASEDLLEGLVGRLEELQILKDQQEAQLREEIASLYRSGGREPLKLLLNQEDPAIFGRMLHYYQALAANRQSKIDEYLQTSQALEQAETSRTEELSYQRQLLASLSDSRAALERRFVERERILSDLENSIADTQAEIAANQENRARLESLVRSISATMAELRVEADQRPFSEIRGQCQWPAEGEMVASFGSVRTGSIRWDGVMIESEMGDSVRAIHNGRVVFSDYLRGYGLLVILDHDEGYLTLYGHNQSLFVETGDWVLPQQMIAQVGNSGGQRDAGLYFEIRKEGEPTNPANWCG